MPLHASDVGGPRYRDEQVGDVLYALSAESTAEIRRGRSRGLGTGHGYSLRWRLPRIPRLYRATGPFVGPSSRSGACGRRPPIRDGLASARRADDRHSGGGGIEQVHGERFRGVRAGRVGLNQRGLAVAAWDVGGRALETDGHGPPPAHRHVLMACPNLL